MYSFFLNLLLLFFVVFNILKCINLNTSLVLKQIPGVATLILAPYSQNQNLYQELPYKGIRITCEQLVRLGMYKCVCLGTWECLIYT